MSTTTTVVFYCRSVTSKKATATCMYPAGTGRLHKASRSLDMLGPAKWSSARPSQSTARLDSPAKKYIAYEPERSFCPTTLVLAPNTPSSTGPKRVESCPKIFQIPAPTGDCGYIARHADSTPASVVLQRPNVLFPFMAEVSTDVATSAITKSKVRGRTAQNCEPPSSTACLMQIVLCFPMTMQSSPHCLNAMHSVITCIGVLFVSLSMYLLCDYNACFSAGV